MRNITKYISDSRYPLRTQLQEAREIQECQSAWLMQMDTPEFEDLIDARILREVNAAEAQLEAEHLIGVGDYEDSNHEMW